MFSWLKPNPLKKLESQHRALTEQAFIAQRNGNIRECSRLTGEADVVRKQIDAMQTANTST